MKKPVVAGLLLIAFALPACSNFAQSTPAVVFTLTFTAIPTLAPANTPLPQTESPQSQTVSAWQGIPIMPDAITGEGDDEGYVFTIKATPQQIEEYYQLELGRLGWQPFGTDEDSPSMLLFTNNASEILTISILTKGDEALVLLVK